MDPDVQRRTAVQTRARALRALVVAGTLCDCEAMAQIADFLASLLPPGTPNRKRKFIDDFGLVCAGIIGRSGTRDTTFMVTFGQTCFKADYQDAGGGNNQVRHFVGFVVAGFFLKTVLGFGALIFNELRGVFTWPDIWLGIQGIDLGGEIDRAVGGVAIEDAGQWIRDEICGCADGDDSGSGEDDEDNEEEEEDDD